MGSAWYLRQVVRLFSYRMRQKAKCRRVSYSFLFMRANGDQLRKIGRPGRIDVLVNNAGRSLIGGAEESSLRQAQSLFDINVFGIVRMTNEVLPIVRKQGKGRIINISSVAGFLIGSRASTRRGAPGTPLEKRRAVFG